MDELSTWLRQQFDTRLAQLDEDEQVAWAASEGGRWNYPGSDSVAGWALYDEHWTIADLKTYRHEDYDYAERMPAVRHPGYVDADANGAHIALWDPKRVLDEVRAERRDIEAKKLILAWCDRLDPGLDLGGMMAPDAREIRRLLAVRFADEPGFRAEWLPTGRPENSLKEAQPPSHVPTNEEIDYPGGDR